MVSAALFVETTNPSLKSSRFSKSQASSTFKQYFALNERKSTFIMLSHLEFARASLFEEPPANKESSGRKRAYPAHSQLQATKEQGLRASDLPRLP
jgi:hypothetical protein